MSYKNKQLTENYFSNDYRTPAEIEGLCEDDLYYMEAEQSFSYLVRGRFADKLYVFYNQNCSDNFLLPKQEKKIAVDIIYKREEPKIKLFKESLRQRGFSLWAENIELICRKPQSIQTHIHPDYRRTVVQSDCTDLARLLGALDALAYNETAASLKSVEEGAVVLSVLQKQVNRCFMGTTER